MPGDKTKKNFICSQISWKIISLDELLELDPLTKKQELLDHQRYVFIKGLLHFFNLRKS